MRAAPPAWVAELDLAPGPPFARMGTRALTGPWLLGGDDLPDLLAEKRRILAARRDDAVAALPGSEAGGAELLAAVRAALGNGGGHGDAPAGRPAGNGGALDRPPAGRGPGAEEPGEAHPVDVAGRLVAEDLCLLRRGSSGWVLAAGSVCFPSHWQLRDKLGHPLATVHDPVPHYAGGLAARVDRFLDRLSPDRTVWRRNWTVHTSPELFAPAPPPPAVAAGAAAAGHLWLRSERQTLRRLPYSGTVAFGIRTQQAPVAALASRPDLCRRLAAAVAAWPPEMVAYRGGEAIHRPLLARLAGLAAAARAEGTDGCG